MIDTCSELIPLDRLRWLINLYKRTNAISLSTNLPCFHNELMKNFNRIYIHVNMTLSSPCLLWLNINVWTYGSGVPSLSSYCDRGWHILWWTIAHTLFRSKREIELVLLKLLPSVRQILFRDSQPEV